MKPLQHPALAPQTQLLLRTTASMHQEWTTKTLPEHWGFNNQDPVLAIYALRKGGSVQSPEAVRYSPRSSDLENKMKLPKPTVQDRRVLVRQAPSHGHGKGAHCIVVWGSKMAAAHCERQARHLPPSHSYCSNGKVCILKLQ